MDDYAEWFMWTASLDLALPKTPEYDRVRHAIGPDKARRVLIVLAAHANPDGYAWPSIPTIMDRANMPRWAVTDGLVFLMAAGVIEKAGKVGRAVRYRLTKGGGRPDTSTPEPSGEPSGQVSGEVSGEVSGTPRPEQEREPERITTGSARPTAPAPQRLFAFGDTIGVTDNDHARDVWEAMVREDGIRHPDHFAAAKSDLGELDRYLDSRGWA